MSKSHNYLITKKLQQNPLQFHKRSKSRQFSNNSYQQQIDKAKQLYNNGELQKALISFESVIQQLSLPLNKIEVYMEACYYSGMICMTTNEYEKSLKYFEKVVENYGNFKGNSLLFLSIVYQKIGRSELSLKVLNELCQKQQSIDGLFYRAKLRFSNMEYKEADRDLSMLINKLQVKNNQIRLLYLQIQLCLNKNIESTLSDAKLILKQIEGISSEQKQTARKCRNILAQVYIKKGKFKEAEHYLEQNLKQKRDSETLFIKSNLHALKRQTVLQILLLNQCINVKDHKIYIKTALENLIVLSLKQKDFYEAFEYSKRNVYLKIENKVTLNLLKMVEAMTLLMKKNFSEGLTFLNSINPTDFSALQESSFIKQLYFGSIAFANFSTGKHKEALKIYEQISLHPQNPDYKIVAYNIKLCEGIINFENGRQQQAIKAFEISSNYLSRPEPYFYIAVILVQHTLQNNPQSAVNHYQLISKVIQIIDSGLNTGDNYQMYYYRSLLYFYLGMSAQALDDVDKAIDKAEENVAKFFYLRALIFLQQKNYESSLAQITTCLSIDQNYFDAYLKKAQIKLFTEEGESYQQDLERHPLHNQWAPLFLLHERKYQKIIDQNLGSTEIQQICKFFTYNFSESGIAGKIIMGIKQQNYKQIIQILDEIQNKDMKIGCLENEDIYLLKSYCYYKMGNNELAIDNVGKCQNRLNKFRQGDVLSENDEKKLLAIKINAIYLMISSGQIASAIMMCDSLINQVYEGQIYDQLSSIKLHLQSIQELNAIPNPISNLTLQKTSQKAITIFNTTPMISDIFPVEHLVGLECRFFIPFPRIKIEDLQSSGVDKILIDFGLESIDNKGESPWMKKDSNGVIFTNNIQVFDNLKLYSESDENQQGDNFKDKIKESLLLDAQVVAKLERIKNREIG